MSRLINISSLNVMLKTNYCLHLPALNCNIQNQCDLLPPPSAKDDHRDVAIMLISITVCLAHLSKCNVSSEKMGLQWQGAFWEPCFPFLWGFITYFRVLALKCWTHTVSPIFISATYKIFYLHKNPVSEVSSLFSSWKKSDCSGYW